VGSFSAPTNCLAPLLGQGVHLNLAPCAGRQDRHTTRTSRSANATRTSRSVMSAVWDASASVGHCPNSSRLRQRRANVGGCLECTESARWLITHGCCGDLSIVAVPARSSAVSAHPAFPLCLRANPGLDGAVSRSQPIRGDDRQAERYRVSAIFVARWKCENPTIILLWRACGLEICSAQLACSSGIHLGLTDALQAPILAFFSLPDWTGKKLWRQSKIRGS
jgi:hypothetical protein